MSTDALPKPPKQWVKGLVPTLNDKGFMFERLDGFAEEFINVAGRSAHPSLEVGCAYGVATLAALDNGARITACDMEPGHLQVLETKVPPGLRKNLTLQAGTLPDIDLPEQHFGTVFCSRVLHFLHGDEIDRSVRNMYRWLRPGGKLYLVADTPFGIWRKFIPVWNANVSAGARWPGLMTEPGKFLPYEPTNPDDVGLKMMNLLDPDLLRRTAAEAGFVVRRTSYIDRNDFSGLGRMDGRENCGLVAVKPG